MAAATASAFGTKRFRVHHRATIARQINFNSFLNPREGAYPSGAAPDVGFDFRFMNGHGLRVRARSCRLTGAKRTLTR